ncbi:MAG: SIS domain-containing protein, partial [Chloroherpetonaceae bacterium]
MKYKDKIENSIRESIDTKQKVLAQLSEKIEVIGLSLTNSIRNGGKIMFCGNGGSAADSQHLAAELVVRLRSTVNRPAIPAIALTVDTSIITAGGNDFGFDSIFSRQIEALGNPADILIAISTSGNSSNIVQAI